MRYVLVAAILHMSAAIAGTVKIVEIPNCKPEEVLRIDLDGSVWLEGKKIGESEKLSHIMKHTDANVTKGKPNAISFMHQTCETRQTQPK